MCIINIFACEWWDKIIILKRIILTFKNICNRLIPMFGFVSGQLFLGHAQILQIYPYLHLLLIVRHVVFLFGFCPVTGCYKLMSLLTYTIFKWKPWSTITSQRGSYVSKFKLLVLLSINEMKYMVLFFSMSMLWHTWLLITPLCMLILFSACLTKMSKGCSECIDRKFCTHWLGVIFLGSHGVFHDISFYQLVLLSHFGGNGCQFV